MQKEPSYFDEAYEFIVKIIIPASAGIAAKVAIQMKNEKLSISRVIISFIAGIVCAYFAYPFINNFADQEYMPALIGLSAISGEKITEYAVYRFKIDVFLGVLVTTILEKIKGKNK